MTEEQRVLISLISVSLGCNEIKLPCYSIAWDRIIDLSYQQEVTALVLDGYQIIHDKIGDQAADKMTLLNWVGGVLCQEAQYDRQFQLAKELSDYFCVHGICTYVLKGFSISQCYPTPKHRYSCDFDCFLVGKDTNGKTISMQVKGDEIIESQGIEVDRSYYKNSSFLYKDLHVENHRFCCSIKRGKKTKDIERYLENYLYESTPSFIQGSKIAVPPLMFQALFLIEHACAHFLYEKMSLKSISDWAMFRKCHKDNLDWVEFHELCQKYGLNSFVEMLDHLADYVIGEYDETGLSRLDRRVLEDTLKQSNLPQNAMSQRIKKAMNMLGSAWKFKYFGRDSMFRELCNSLYAYLFDRNPKLEA